jgi:hypothetical protein
MNGATGAPPPADDPDAPPDIFAANGLLPSEEMPLNVAFHGRNARVSSPTFPNKELSVQVVTPLLQKLVLAGTVTILSL